MSFRAILLLVLASLSPLPSHASGPCPDLHTASQAALAYLLDRQDEIDELRAGGHGPLRIAYLHPPGDTHRPVLTRLAVKEDLQLTAYRVRVGTRPADLAYTARQVADYQADWVLVSSGPVWHGAILTALSRAGIASPHIILLERASRPRAEKPEPQCLILDRRPLRTPVLRAGRNQVRAGRTRARVPRPGAVAGSQGRGTVRDPPPYTSGLHNLMAHCRILSAAPTRCRPSSSSHDHGERQRNARP